MDNVSQYLQMMDANGQAPVMQDISGQKSLYQQNMGGMKALSNQALGQPNASPLQSMADALRKYQTAQPGLGQMRDIRGNVVPDPTYGTGGSVMANPGFNPYENPV
jgi:hypothetical protein